MVSFKAFLIELWLTIKAHLIPILSLIGTVMVGLITFMSKNRESDTEDRKTDIERDRLMLDRDRQSDDRYDRLVSHLERMLEETRKESHKEREKMRGEIRAQTRKVIEQSHEIRELKVRVGSLLAFIEAHNLTPPAHH